MKIHLCALPFLLGIGSQISLVNAAPSADPLSKMAFIGRRQTENYSTKATAAKPAKPLGLFKDVACTQPATTAGDNVAAVHDEFNKSGLVLTQTESTKCPTLQFVEGHPVLRFDGIDDHYLLSTSLPMAKLDLWMRYKINVAPNQPYSVIASAQGGDLDFLPPNGFTILVQDNQRSTGQNMMQVTHLHSNNGTSTLFVEGVPVSDGKFHQGTATRLSVGSRLMPDPSTFLAMDMDALLIGTDIPAADYPIIDKYLGANLDAPRLVCLGDSITDGSMGTDGGMYATQEYPSQLQLMRPKRFVINSGQWGARISSALPVDQLYSKDGQLVVFVGTNDLVGPKSAEETFGEFAAYCKARREAGWKVYAGTMLPRSHGAGTPNAADFEEKRQAFNKSLHENYTTFADGLVDFAADSRIGDNGDEKDTKYYLPDQVHLTVAGATVLAELVNAALPKD